MCAPCFSRHHPRSPTSLFPASLSLYPFSLSLSKYPSTSLSLSLFAYFLSVSPSLFIYRYLSASLHVIELALVDLEERLEAAEAEARDCAEK